MKACLSFLARWSLAVSAFALLTTPLAAPAQSMQDHDMSSMPGMDMGPTPPVKKPVLKEKSPSKVAPAPSTSATPQPDTSMKDHEMSSMPGMTKGHEHDAMPGMDHGGVQQGRVDAPMDERGGKSGDVPMSTGSGSMQMGAMQGGAAPPDARDPDAYADGLEMGHMPGMDMADDAKHLYVLVDRLEATKTHAGHGQALDAQAWYGGDLDKLWLKVDGERSNGRLGATRTEALWNHAVATYWGLQAGVRQDFGDGPGRTWASIGVQGLSPYWFDVQVTAYVGEGGRTALRLETEYDLSLTQRLILQPDLKVDVFGRDDARRGIGAGLSDIEAAVRLRYEITRKVAPYVGVVWNRKFGNTARFARQTDGPAQKIEAVAGVRFWF